VFSPRVPLDETVPVSTHDWTSIVVNVQGGAASSTIGFIDVFINYEVQWLVDDEMNYFIQPSAIDNPRVIKASNEVTRHSVAFVGHDDTVDATFLGRARLALGNGMRMVGDAVMKDPLRAMSIAQAAYSGNYASAGSQLYAGSSSHSYIRDVD
jgi:hypothetical protein